MSAVHLDQVAVTAGTTVQAWATGFFPDETLHLSVVGAAGVVARSSGRTDGDGSATIEFAIPVDRIPVPGSYDVLIMATKTVFRQAMTGLELTSLVMPAETVAPGPPVAISGVASDTGRADHSNTATVDPPVVPESRNPPVDIRDPRTKPEIAALVPPVRDGHEADRATDLPAVTTNSGRAQITEPHIPDPPTVTSEPARTRAIDQTAAVEAGEEPGASENSNGARNRDTGADPSPQVPGEAEERWARAPRSTPRIAPFGPASHTPTALKAEPAVSATERPGPRHRSTPIGKVHPVLPRAILAGLVLGGGLLGTIRLPTTPRPVPVVVGSAPTASLARTRLPGRPNLEETGETPASDLGSGFAVTLAFGGDVHFEGALAKRLRANPRTVLDAARPLFSGADLTMVNLETAVTNGGSAQPKQFTFRAPPSAFTALTAAGVTVATQANNHGADYGPKGVSDSINEAKRAGFPLIGIGNDVTEAFAPYRATLNGQRLAIIAATQVLDDNLAQDWTATETQAGLASAYDTAHLLAAVRQARATSDTVVVYLHWGTELNVCPNPLQRPLAERLVDAGADIVVGSHAHVQLGGGRLGRAFVDYGLGNFAFYATHGTTAESGILQVTITGRRVESYRWVPARIINGVPVPLHGSAATGAQASWAKQRSCTGLGT